MKRLCKPVSILLQIPCTVFQYLMSEMLSASFCCNVGFFYSPRWITYYQDNLVSYLRHFSICNIVSTGRHRKIEKMLVSNSSVHSMRSLELMSCSIMFCFSQIWLWCRFKQWTNGFINTLHGTGTQVRKPGDQRQLIQYSRLSRKVSFKVAHYVVIL